MNIAVSFPVYLNTQTHIDWLNKTTLSLRSRDHALTILPVENFIKPDYLPYHYQVDQAQTDIIPLSVEPPQSVAKAWNTALQFAELKYDYLLIINTDIVLKSNAIDRLVMFAHQTPEAFIWTASEWADEATIEQAGEDENYNEHPHFSCFLVRPQVFLKHCGLFDEHFTPAYLEDNDMAARMGLAGQKAYTYGGARFFHAGSRTIKTDPAAWSRNLQTFPANQQYFLRKWGHPPVGEVSQMQSVYYKTPFDLGGPLSDTAGNTMVIRS